MNSSDISADIERLAALLKDQYGYSSLTIELLLEAAVKIIKDSPHINDVEKMEAFSLLEDHFHGSISSLLEFLEDFNTDLRKNGTTADAFLTEDTGDTLLQQIRNLLQYAGDSLAENYQKWLKEHQSGNTAVPVKASEAAGVQKGEKKETAGKLIAKADALQKKLFTTVRGQNQAVSFLVSGWLEGEVRNLIGPKDERPRASVLFAGPHGSGMSLLVHTFAREVHEPCFIFSTSNQDNGQMTAAAMIGLVLRGNDHPSRNEPARKKCIFVIDHMDPGSASYSLQQFLAGILNGEIQNEGTVSFRDCMFIFTTSAGADTLYENPDIPDCSVLRADEITEALKKETVTGKDGKKYPAYVPYFLDLCAEGKVAVFADVKASVMKEIAAHTLEENAQEMKKNMHASCTIDPALSKAILFHLGEKAKADTVRHYASDFFTRQITELFRISGNASESIRKVSFKVSIPESGEASDLFEQKKKQQALLFMGKQESNHIHSAKYLQINKTDSLSKAESILMKKDIRLILLDFTSGMQEKRYSSIEDIDSDGRKFFLWLRKEHADIPVYLLETEKHIYSEEEKLSFTRRGVAGFLNVQEESFRSRLSTIASDLYLEDAMLNLEKERGQLSWGTRQYIGKNGNAVIELYDLTIRKRTMLAAGDGAVSDVQQPHMKFDDIIGAEDAKQELKFFISYLKNPRLFMGSGLSAPKGVLLYGPPGTGKTMLAKAIASEAGISFIACDGSEFLKKYVGEGPELVHRYFQKARKFAPAVLFIDEIDAIGLNRSSEDARYSRDILTSFFTEMDGFHTSSTKPVFVIAATNASIDPAHPGSIDPALLRRFDRHIFVDLPDLKGREEYLKKEIKKYPSIRLSQNDIHTIAENTSGLSLAVVSQILDLAKRLALRQAKKVIDEALITEAMEQYTNGDRRTRNEAESLRTARHEAGHAFLQWKAGKHPAYVSIESRSDHHGYVRSSEEEFEKMNSRKELTDYIRMCLGGRAAELVYYGKDDGLTMGPSADLKQATNAAVQLFCTYGMDASFGLASVDPDHLSTAKKEELLNKVNALLAEELKKAEKTISDNKPVIDAFCRILMKREHLNGNEIDEIFQKEMRKQAA